MSGVKSLEVDVNASCSRYASDMAGFVKVGVLRRGNHAEGVLAFNTKARIYVRVNGAAIEVLKDRELAAVLSSLERQQQLRRTA